MKQEHLLIILIVLVAVLITLVGVYDVFRGFMYLHDRRELMHRPF